MVVVAAEIMVVDVDVDVGVDMAVEIIINFPTRSGKIMESMKSQKVHKVVIKVYKVQRTFVIVVVAKAIGLVLAVY